MTVMLAISALIHIVTNLNAAGIGHFKSLNALALMRVTFVNAD